MMLKIYTRVHTSEKLFPAKSVGKIYNVFANLVTTITLSMLKDLEVQRNSWKGILGFLSLNVLPFIKQNKHVNCTECLKCRSVVKNKKKAAHWLIPWN